MFRRSKIKKTRNKYGIALIMVLATVALLTIMVSQFFENTSIYQSVNNNNLDSIKAEYLARSSINLSRLVLVIQPSLNRMLKSFKMPSVPMWKYADYMLNAFNDPEGSEFLGSLLGASFSNAEGLGGFEGKFSVKIVDEDSKININAAATSGLKDIVANQLSSLIAPVQYNKLFEEFDIDDQYTDRDTVVGAIIDWVDSDYVPYGFTSGAEDETVYSNAIRPYQKKDAPLDSLEELRFVRSIGDDFWTAFIEPNPEEPENRILTVWGQGKININTAPPLVLAALICGFAQNPNDTGCDPTNTQGILTLVYYIDMMRNAGGVLPGLGGFTSIDEFLTLVNDGAEGIVTGIPINRTEASRNLSTESRVFSIYAVGEVGNVRKEIHAVVDTRGSLVQQGGALIYWREE